MIIRMAWKNAVRFCGLWCYIAVSLVLAYYAGGAVSLARMTGMSLAEYMLYVLTDHYYLVYAWFFFLLYWIVQRVRRNEPTVLVRYGSYQAGYNIDNLAAVLQLAAMIGGNLILVFCIGIIGIGFSGGFRTIGLAGSFGGDLDVLRGYAAVFPGPVTALLCVVLYWAAGCIFLYLLLYYVHCIAGRKGMLLGMFLCVVSNIIGFMTQIDESWLCIFFFNNYYILHHALLLTGVKAVCMNITVMAVGYIGVREIAKWRKGMLI